MNEGVGDRRNKGKFVAVRPLLQALHDLGGSGTIEEISSKVKFLNCTSAISKALSEHMGTNSTKKQQSTADLIPFYNLSSFS